MQRGSWAPVQGWGELRNPIRSWQVALAPPALPYLSAGVLVGPERSVSHNDPVLVQDHREGLWPPQPSPSGRVLDLGNALSHQRVQILNVLQD